MSTYFDMSRALASDNVRRLPCIALVEGREALIRDAMENTGGSVLSPNAQRWMWPGPGDLESAKIGGRTSTETIYDIKLKGAVLDNVWERSLREVSAEPFTSAPTLEGWPEPMVKRDKDGRIVGGWVKRLGFAGEGLLGIWRETFFLKQALGIYYQLLDLPSDPGLDPYWTGTSPTQILRLVPPLPGGRLREVAIKVPARLGGKAPGPPSDPNDLPDDPDFSKKEAWWVRVYRTSEYHGDAADGPALFRHAAMSQKDKTKVVWVEDDWQELEARKGVFQDIPLLPFYGKRVGPYRGWPEFADASSLQMDLWRSMADYGMRKTNDYRSILAVSGTSLADLEQRGSLICMKDPAAKATQLETTGAAQEAARADHEVSRHRIRWMCMRKIQQSKPQPQQTATEINADVTGSRSWLEAQVMMDIASMQLGLEWTAQLGGLDPEGGTVDLPHDFTRLPGSFASLEKGYFESEGRTVPTHLYWREKHRLGGIAADEDPEAIADEVEKVLKEDRGITTGAPGGGG